MRVTNEYCIQFTINWEFFFSLRPRSFKTILTKEIPTIKQKKKLATKHRKIVKIVSFIHILLTIKNSQNWFFFTWKKYNKVKLCFHQSNFCAARNWFIYEKC